MSSRIFILFLILPLIYSCEDSLGLDSNFQKEYVDDEPQIASVPDTADLVNHSLLEFYGINDEDLGAISLTSFSAVSFDEVLLDTNERLVLNAKEIKITRSFTGVEFEFLPESTKEVRLKINDFNLYSTAFDLRSAGIELEVDVIDASGRERKYTNKDFELQYIYYQNPSKDFVEILFKVEILDQASFVKDLEIGANIIFDQELYFSDS